MFYPLDCSNVGTKILFYFFLLEIALLTVRKSPMLIAD